MNEKILLKNVHATSLIEAAWNTFNATEIYYSMLISMQNSWQLNSKMQKLLVSAFWCAATPFWISCIWQKFWGTKLALA